MIGSPHNINGSSREIGIARLVIKVANHRRYPVTAKRCYESTKTAAVPGSVHSKKYMLHQKRIAVKVANHRKISGTRELLP